jgi:hypothetical protein
MIEEMKSFLEESASSNISDDRKAGVFYSPDGLYKYRLGIIDFLTAYNTAKKVEKTFNDIISWKDNMGASCQEPAIYADRFIKFLRENL